MLRSDIAEGTRLLLIRHGETEWNRDQRVQGHQDVPLSETGREQARRLRDRLHAEPDVIYTSDLQRAWMTAEILAQNAVGVIPEARLREVGMGRFEGLSIPEIRLKFPVAWTAWRRDAIRHRPPGGETLEDLQARVFAAVGDRLPRHPGQTVALVTHAGVVRVLVCGLLRVGLEVYPHLRVDNASITRFEFRAQGPSLVGFNEVGHLRDFGAGGEGGDR